MGVVHRVYARALYDAAKEEGIVEETREELADFVAAVRDVPELRAVLRNPQIDPRAKSSALEAITGGVHDIVRNFLMLLAEKGRIGEVEEMQRELERLVAREQGQINVELTTAQELTDEEARGIVDQIAKASGRNVEATRKVDPDLIGGVVLQAGSFRIDALGPRPPRTTSPRARLENLRSHFEATPRRDHVDPQAADRGVQRRDRAGRGRHRAPDRRRHRPHLRARERGLDGDARARARRHRPRLQPRGGQRRRRAVRRVAARQGRRARPPHRPRRQRPRRRGADRPHRRPARQPGRRRAAARAQGDAPARVQGAGRRRPPAGEGAAADRHQGDRLADPDRPRPARADPRRPDDRQDGDLRRHDPQPARAGRDLHLRRHRPEGLDGGAGVRAAQGRGRDGLHDHRHGRRARGRADQVDGALRRRGDGRALPLQRQARARACTTTCRSTPTPTGRCRCSSAARRAARPSRATCSTSTRGCSSAPASSRTSSAAAR